MTSPTTKLDNLKSLLATYETEGEKGNYDRLQMLRLLENKGIKAFYRENIENHFTASAWIVHPQQEEVLLLHHKKLNKWLQAGGHADGEVNLEKVARKEAEEETGLKNLQLVSTAIFDIDIHTIPTHKGIPQHDHYDVRFAYFCENKEYTKINSESNHFQWINYKEVETVTQETSILRMVEKTKKIINGT